MDMNMDMDMDGILAGLGGREGRREGGGGKRQRARGGREAREAIYVYFDMHFTFTYLSNYMHIPAGERAGG